MQWPNRAVRAAVLSLTLLTLTTLHLAASGSRRFFPKHGLLNSIGSAGSMIIQQGFPFLTMEECDTGLPRHFTHFPKGLTHPGACGSPNSFESCQTCAPGWTPPCCQHRVLVDLCTAVGCLNTSRCSLGPLGEPARFHVYEVPNWAKESTFSPGGLFNGMMADLKLHPQHTSNPDEACIFVPWIDTLCEGNGCLDTWTRTLKVDSMGKLFRKLSHWDDGRNHLILIQNDASEPMLPAEKAIFVAAPMWNVGGYRPGYDIAAPLWDRSSLGSGGPPSQKVRLNSTRPILLGYKGQLGWFDVHSAPQLVREWFDSSGRAQSDGNLRNLQEDWIRMKATQLHNGEDVISVGYCTGMGGMQLNEETCKEHKSRADKWDYKELLSSAEFGLILPGISPMSYRLAETMSYGSIPVVVSDYISLPFPDLIRWREFVVVVAEGQVLEVPDILRRISVDKRRRMRERVNEVYEKYMASLAKVMLGAMEAFSVRSQIPWITI